jgi:malonate decarboxylase alpha subunit
MNGPVLPSAKVIEALETLIVSGDRIVLEGDNQKQADFLSRSLVKVDPRKLHDLHLDHFEHRPARTSHPV